MTDDRAAVIEQIQGMVVSLVATHPAGAGLCLVGGFRYRFLDNGPRRSVDIDYHWEGDLADKQTQLIRLFERRLLPDVRRRLGLDGSVAAPRGGAAESIATAVVDLAFWNLRSTLGRIEIPVDIIRIECVDSPAVRTAGGVVYRTASDADMLEAKAIAVVYRTFLEYRDLVDLYLFASHAAADAHLRLADKCRRLNIDATRVAARLDDLAAAGGHHAAGIESVIRQQVDPEPVAAILAAGGGPIVLEAVRQLLETLFGWSREASS